MNARALPGWLLPLWLQLWRDADRLPHALLFAGAPGSGKRAFAELLAQSLLCERRAADRMPCGECGACNWYVAGNHPDMHRMVPASALQEEAEEGEEGGSERKASSQIVIDQVREMQGTLETGSHQGGRRVVLVDPAEAMNVHTANALLKSLEEPPGNAVFLLVSHAPQRLLPTIRSRCQVRMLPRPDASQAAVWLREQGSGEAANLLGFASGLPLAAQALVDSGLSEARSRFVRDMLTLSGSDGLKLAGEWESWLKSKTAQQADLNMSRLVSWLQRWVYDLARVAAGASPRFFADRLQDMQRLAQGRGAAWLSCYNELASVQRVSRHPLNARLLIEDMLMRVARTMTRT